MNKKILKKRLIIFIFIYVVACATLFLKDSYAKYISDFNNLANVQIAKPIIVYNGLSNSNNISLNLPLDEINPRVGQKTYTFEIKNETESRITEVDINYELLISTTNNLPLDITLSSISSTPQNSNINSTMTGEKISRSFIGNFYHSQSETHNYVLTIKWQDGIEDYRYSSEIDVIDIIVNWQQKKGDV